MARAVRTPEGEEKERERKRLARAAERQALRDAGLTEVLVTIPDTDAARASIRRSAARLVSQADK